MYLPRAILLVSSLCVFFGCQAPPENPSLDADLADQEDPAQPSGPRALDSMVSGEWSGWELPAVDWDSVDGLLERADSMRQLVSFPTNPLSSMSQPTCTEGAMALWLIEALRAESATRFPSLNPMLLGGSMEEDDWHLISNRNQPIAAKAYRYWWSLTRDMSPDARRTAEPLAGSGVAWY